MRVERPVDPAEFATLSFLVVDDDAMVRSILVDFLKSFGFSRIQEAKNGRAALKLINDMKVRIDVVISDWEMPGADGFTLLKAVRQNPQRASCKFIMVTSQNSRERLKISKALLWKVDAYIVKPFRSEILKEKIFSVLGWFYAAKPEVDSKKTG